MSTPRLRYRVPGCRFEFVAQLPNYKLFFHKRSNDGSAKCNAFKRALLSQLQNDLLPTQIAHAKVHMAPEGNSRTSEPGANSLPKLHLKLFDASFDGASSTTLRFDQMLDARAHRVHLRDARFL